MIMRLRASALAAAAVLAIAASSSVPAMASEGLAPTQPAVSKRFSPAPAPAAHVIRKAAWHKPARVAWSDNHNAYPMLGVAY
jgi:hypothetical protein